MRSAEFVDQHRSIGLNEPGSGPEGQSGSRWIAWLGTIVLGVAFAAPSGADVLADCRSLSTADDDVHVCLDNFLDDLDDSMELLAGQVGEEVDDNSSAMFTRSQAAFVDYRRQNCLWYVSFSDPRALAEQLGKNCLIDMTRDRLAELRELLVASEQSRGRLQGYYVHGGELNSFIACGSGSRYWVESENGAADELQQTYSDLASADRQLLYADLMGTLEEEPEAREGHAGRADVTDIATLRIPLESDCPLPSASDVTTAVLVPDQGADDDQQADADDGEVEQVSAQEDDEPEQQLNAYFGAWQAACLQRGSDYSCNLSTELEDPSAGEGDAGPPVRMRIQRQPEEQTTVELRFDDVEIDRPSRIRWSIDDGRPEAIAFSVVRVDESATRQVISDPDYLSRELLPGLQGGSDVSIDLVENEDDVSGELFTGTLMGLSRALAFADDFIESGN